LGSDLDTELKTTKDRKLLMMLDVAFKGFDLGKESVPDPTLRDVSMAVFGGEEKGEVPMPTDRVLFLATDLAHDALTTADGKAGMFAAAVLDALKGKADGEGYEPDGLVTVDELVKSVEKDVADEARKIGKNVKEKEAVPFILGEEIAHFAVTKNPAAAPKAEERLAKLAALETAGKVAKDAAEEGRMLLGRMPKLKAQQDLRKKFQALTDGTLTAEAFAKERDAMKESLKLNAEETHRFARTVLRGVDRLKESYVKELNLGDVVGGGIKGLYRRLDVDLPTDIADLVKDAKTLSRPKLMELLQVARERLGKREDLADDKDVDMTILMATASLNDPYTTYYDKELIKKTESQLRGEFRGIGIQIRRDSVRDGLLVVSPIKGSPAYLAGILAGDIITEIKRDVDAEGKPLAADAPKVISTQGMKTEQALELILGKPGIPVTLTVQRDGPDGKPVTKDYTIERGVVSVETVLGVKRDKNDDWQFYLDPEKKIAYVYLTQFSPSTFKDLYTVLKKLQADGMKGLVLDLRLNPGGLLVSAVQICNLFVDEGVIVSVRPRVGKEERWFARGRDVIAVKEGLGPVHRDNGREGKPFDGFPMVVLVNNFSASAAEIVSACLQDYNRAVVVGERSFGKGSVQSISEFSATQGQLKMTTARYFPPLGRNIDKLSTESQGKDEKDEWGVKPDNGFEVKLSREEKQALSDYFRDREIIHRTDVPAKDDEKKPFQDKQLERALDYVREQLKAGAKVGAKKDG
ncbi:MAG: S41 family peptidase, partial [Fimbriiglobus sp.]